MINQILDRIERKVQDSSYERILHLLPLVNQGLETLATSVIIPTLTVSGKVDCLADQFKIAAPDDFHSHLLKAYNLDQGQEVKVWKRLPEFLDKFPGLDVDWHVTHVCEHGGTIYYQGVPSATEQLRIFYTGTPQLFEWDYASESWTTATVSWLPSTLQKRLLVNYALMELFEEIEQEEEGEPVNYLKYKGKFKEAKGELIRFVGLPQDTPDFVPDNEGTFDSDYF